MTIDFTPRALPAWIGSLPLEDHDRAVAMMWAYTPEIPLWIQLPRRPAEGMIHQFLPGMPGLRAQDGRIFIQTGDDAFDDDLLAFFEETMDIARDPSLLNDSRFALTLEVAPGFFALLNTLDARNTPPLALKGQVTGPFTFATSVADQDGRAIFYHDALRGAAVACISLKARWQVRQLKKYKVPVILFLDEPGLAGFGSSAFISVSRQDVADSLEEVMAAVHAEGALAGVHVCANCEWPVILESSADIVSFDAYSFFDKFILYPKQIKTFIEKGGIIAWGIVPTGDIAAVEQESVESLFALWENEVGRLMSATGFSRSRILDQSLITPSCGTGSLPLAAAEKVVGMTKELSDKIRGQV
jgi:methionine synthase II (cobalamin-independent)